MDQSLTVEDEGRVDAMRFLWIDLKSDITVIDASFQKANGNL